MTNDFRNAAYEAIYFWNRYEWYYHEVFLKVEVLKQNDEAYDFFIAKVFETFLKEYSIRRNLPAGHEVPKKFMSVLIELGFTEEIKMGNTKIIDRINGTLKSEFRYKSTISLLSKIAFLINPSAFSLYDSLARKSVYELLKHRNVYKYAQLSQYDHFIAAINILIKDYQNELTTQMEVLTEFDDSPAVTYFSQNPEAFHMRILDKYLWIQSTSRSANNDGFRKFLEIIEQ